MKMLVYEIEYMAERVLSKLKDAGEVNAACVAVRLTPAAICSADAVNAACEAALEAHKEDTSVYLWTAWYWVYQASAIADGRDKNSWPLGKKGQIQKYIDQADDCLKAPALMTGWKVRAASKQGHEAIHGTKEEKQQKWARYQQAVNQCHEENLQWGITAIHSKVAEDFDCSTKTIQRHTQNPIK